MKNITIEEAVNNIFGIIQNPINNTQQDKNKEFYEYLDDISLKEVKEAVKYFSKRFRITEDNQKDEFILMTKEQVALFNQLKVEPYGKVKTRIEYMDEKHTRIYCYILYREHDYVPSHKIQAKLKNIK